MKIALLGTAYFQTENFKKPPRTNGITGYISELIEFLLARNCSIEFIGKIYYYTEKELIEYHPLFDKEIGNNKFLLQLLKKSFSLRLDNQTVIHANRPDHLYIFSLFQHQPALITIHGQQAITVSRRKGPITRAIYFFMEKRALRKARSIILTDQISYDFYSKRYPNIKSKLHVFPTSVNINKFKPFNRDKLREKHQFGKDEKIILYVGRIEPPKRVEEIIDAFCIMNKEIKNARLLIIGDGVEKEELEAKLEKKSIEKQVQFLGNKQRNELPEYINCANISVLYSFNEGGPLAVKESLACGVPVVANKVGDIPEFVHNGKTGYLVENESIEELAKCMKSCIEESDDMALNCVEMMKNYSTDKMFENVYHLYEAAIRKA
jgi:glycosyltransferase involved in cell wall biosynthesis